MPEEGIRPKTESHMELHTATRSGQMRFRCERLKKRVECKLTESDTFAPYWKYPTTFSAFCLYGCPGMRIPIGRAGAVGEGGVERHRARRTGCGHRRGNDHPRRGSKRVRAGNDHRPCGFVRISLVGRGHL